MNAPNLFDRLEGYARENFTTETLAYILQTNPEIRRRFVRLIDRQNEELKAFGDFSVETQDAYDLGRPDLILVPKKKKTQKIFIEVKTQAQEGKAQLSRYLKIGAYVAYLTPPGFTPHSDVGKRTGFLGHFFWHDVYRIIDSATPKDTSSSVSKQFLAYLEARNMGPIKPMTEEELRSAENAVGFFKKSHALVDKVRGEIELEWKKRFGRNVGAKETCMDTGDVGLHLWWFRTKKWEKSPSKLYLCIGTCLDGKRRQKAYFFVGFGSSRKLFVRRLQHSSKKKLSKLSDHGWREVDEPGYEWGYYKYFPLTAGKIERAASRHADQARTTINECMRLGILDRIEKSA